MLHDMKQVEAKDGSMKIQASLFVSKLVLPGYNLAAATVTAKALSGGATPGPDVEIFVEVTIPKVAAKPVSPIATGQSGPPPAPPAPVVKH